MLYWWIDGHFTSDDYAFLDWKVVACEELEKFWKGDFRVV
jgi:hypothetical protein